MKTNVKFRAWEDWTEIEKENNMKNKLPNKMYFWEELVKCNKVWFAQLLQGEHSHIKLMQFTGLKDKNGKEIYEGDIVKIIWCSKAEEKREEYTDGNYYFGLIKWGYVSVYMAEYESPQFYADCWFPKSETFKKRRYKEDTYESLFNESIKKVEVIGNIYENPELLKQVAEKK